MNILRHLFLFNKTIEIKERLNQEVFDHYGEIANLVKEARIKRNLTIKDLSKISKIPQQTINSIENNNPKYIPKYPFIRSVLIKLEECLYLKKNTLVKLAIREEVLKREKQNFILRKFDLMNTWQGTILYFFILILTIFFLKKYFILNVNIIEIQNIENEFIEK